MVLGLPWRHAFASLDPVTADDPAAVARAKADRAAFAALYRAYVDPIYAYWYHRLGDVPLAEDATQQVFAQALDRLHACHDATFRGLASSCRRARQTTAIADRSAPWTAVPDARINGMHSGSATGSARSLTRCSTTPIGDLKMNIRRREGTKPRHGAIQQVNVRTSWHAREALDLILLNHPCACDRAV
jgi:hypothetical protein